MLKLKKIIKSLFSLIGFIMSKVVPVNEHLVVFGDLPGFRDALGEYEFVSNNFPEKNCVYVKRGSLTVRNILSCIFAKYYVYSCYPGDVSKVFFHGKTLINVWHGMPVKEIETNRTIKSYENEYYFPYLLSHKLAKQRYFLIPSPMIMQKFVDAFEDRVEQFVDLQTTRFASVAHDPRFNGQADGCLVIWSSFLNQEHQAVDTIKCLERELLNDFRFVLHSFHPLNETKFNAFRKLSKKASSDEIPSTVFVYESSIIYQANLSTTFVTPKRKTYDVDSHIFEQISDKNNFIYWKLRCSESLIKMEDEQRKMRWKVLLKGDN